MTAAKAQADHEKLIANEQELCDMDLGSEEAHQDDDADDCEMTLHEVDDNVHVEACEDKVARSSGKVDFY